jgi:hypothetical protein
MGMERQIKNMIKIERQRKRKIKKPGSQSPLAQ